jgi:hypothetical protein
LNRSRDKKLLTIEQACKNKLIGLILLAVKPNVIGEQVISD